MKKVVAFLCIVQVLLFGADYIKELKAYLSANTFSLDGIMYTYDFGQDGKIDYNDWVYVSTKSGKKYRLLGTTPSANNAFGFKEVAIDLGGASAQGYFSFIDFPLDTKRSFSWIYIAKDGKVYKLMGATQEHFFKYLQVDEHHMYFPDMSAQIEDNEVAVVYTDFSSFPSLVSNYDTNGFSWSLEVEGNRRVYIADGPNGVVVLNIEGEHLYNPLKEGDICIDTTRDIAIDEAHNHLAAAFTHQGVALLDKESLQQIAKSEQAGYFEDLVFAPNKDVLYGLDGDGNLLLFCDLLQNQLHFVKTLTQDAKGVVVTQHFLYALKGEQGVIQYSLEDAANPSLVATLPLYGYDRGVAAKDDRFFYLGCADQKNEFDVIDSSGHFVKAIFNPHPFSKMVLDEEHHCLYLLNSVSSIDVYDIGNPLAPTFVKTIYIPYPAMDMKIAKDGSVGYIADGGQGFLAIELQ